MMRTARVSPTTAPTSRTSSKPAIPFCVSLRLVVAACLVPVTLSARALLALHRRRKLSKNRINRTCDYPPQLRWRASVPHQDVAAVNWSRGHQPSARGGTQLPFAMQVSPDCLEVAPLLRLCQAAIAVRAEDALRGDVAAAYALCKLGCSCCELLDVDGGAQHGVLLALPQRMRKLGKRRRAVLVHVHQRQQHAHVRRRQWARQHDVEHVGQLLARQVAIAVGIERVEEELEVRAQPAGQRRHHLVLVLTTVASLVPRVLVLQPLRLIRDAAKDCADGDDACALEDDEPQQPPRPVADALVIHHHARAAQISVAAGRLELPVLDEARCERDDAARDGQAGVDGLRKDAFPLADALVATRDGPPHRAHHLERVGTHLHIVVDGGGQRGPRPRDGERAHEHELLGHVEVLVARLELGQVRLLHHGRRVVVARVVHVVQHRDRRARALPQPPRQLVRRLMLVLGFELHRVLVVVLLVVLLVPVVRQAAAVRREADDAAT
mmetsp:Transcript_2453/g.8317  ORF Transcript_2453/g.8317 Transcript_2453/m.8317 type:complete len:496 (-) Transcript_2453:2918-4405(-)